MNSLAAVFTALLFWLAPAESDTRFTKYVLSSSSGNYSTTSSSYTQPTNLSVSFKSTGRPIVMKLIAAGTTSGLGFAPQFGTSENSDGRYAWRRDSSDLVDLRAGAASGTSIPFTDGPSHYDFPSAGTYTYSIRVKTGGVNTFWVSGFKLLVYELP